MKKLIILFFILAVIYAADKNGFLNAPKGILEKIIAFRIAFPENRQIRKLREENLELLAKIIDQRNLQLENEALRAQLAAPQRVAQKFLPARVLSVNTNFIIIDKGRLDGVKLGQTAVYKNILAGRVVSLSESRSRVDLAIKSESKIPARTSRNALGMVLGTGGGIVLANVTLSETLEAGDLVFTAPNQDFLPDLLIGEITRVSRDERALFQQAQVQSPLNFKKLEMVFLIP